VADPRLNGATADGGARPELGISKPRFYYDFASPESWLAAERVNQELPTVPVWVPVRARPPGPPKSAELAGFELRAAAMGLPTPRLPDPWPADLDLALRAATFAAVSGRVVAFSLAALRQAFAAGRDLSEPDNVLIAAAACELHPRAVLKGVESRSIEQRLREASNEAVKCGLSALPAVAQGGEVFSGSDAVDLAAVALDVGG
jgi:2-hydroxychromene-2-carboxylate isomerase